VRDVGDTEDRQRDAQPADDEPAAGLPVPGVAEQPSRDDDENQRQESHRNADRPERHRTNPATNRTGSVDPDRNCNDDGQAEQSQTQSVTSLLPTLLRAPLPALVIGIVDISGTLCTTAECANRRSHTAGRKHPQPRQRPPDRPTDDG